MKIPLTYLGPFPSVNVDIGRGHTVTVKRGDAADVPKETADYLLKHQPNRWKNAKTIQQRNIEG